MVTLKTAGNTAEKNEAGGRGGYMVVGEGGAVAVGFTHTDTRLTVMRMK